MATTLSVDTSQQEETIRQKEIDEKLAELAKNGDLEAIKLLAERKNDRIELDLRRELLGV